eukprot:2399979-Prorocentrum_lima.AAC.1
MYKQTLQWDGSSDPIDQLAITNLLRLNRMEQPFMEMTKYFGIMKGHLSPQDVWVVAPPIVGVS